MQLIPEFHLSEFHCGSAVRVSGLALGNPVLVPHSAMEAYWLVTQLSLHCKVVLKVK